MNRIALITGAGSGVGRAASLALLREGFSVVLAGRRQEALEETARLAGERRRETLVVPTDVADPASVQSLFAQIEQVHGRLDLLFNNAGINVPATPLEDLSWERWQSVVATNLSGVFLCTQHAFRVMKEQQPMGGRIINNGSVSAQAPRPDSAAYTATKHAVSGLTKSASLEGRKYNIACGQIDIGNAWTEMSARSRAGTLQANGSIAVEPMMAVEDVAKAVVYMATLPLEANVQFMTVMATKMPLVGRG
jgi:NAD(P)-dependent dehydrogenase (short-subunit alcohol dehydrogenase family)